MDSEQIRNSLIRVTKEEINPTKMEQFLYNLFFKLLGSLSLTFVISNSHLTVNERQQSTDAVDRLCHRKIFCEHSV